MKRMILFMAIMLCAIVASAQTKCASEFTNFKHLTSKYYTAETVVDGEVVTVYLDRNLAAKLQSNPHYEVVLKYSDGLWLVLNMGED